MPDADDFDIEYFRNLLKGNGPKEGQAPPAEPTLSATKKKMPSRGNQAVARSSSTAKVARKRGKKS